MRLENKVALISGAGSVGPGWGNGKATAVAFAREGARIFAVDLAPEAAEVTRDIIASEGGVCETHTCDVTDAAQVEAMISACVERFGRIDILVNNVGGSVPGDPVELSEEAWRGQLDFNLTSAFLACKHALPHMARQGNGAIVNISSIAGLRHIGNDHVGYAAAKAGLVQFGRALAVKYAPLGIRCNSISPGLMHTPLVEVRLAGQYGADDVGALIEKRNKQVPMGHMGEGWDVAYAALYLASDEAKYVTAIDLVVDGGLIAATP
jgi:NAD(P)-dependent dehydrogenase (short-subunit alcohol dehydrogenase family)